MENRDEINDYLTRCFSSLSSDLKDKAEERDTLINNHAKEIEEYINSPIPTALSDVKNELQKMNDYRAKVFSNRWKKATFKLSILFLLLLTTTTGINKTLMFLKTFHCEFTQTKLNKTEQQIKAYCLRRM
jgi:hypothetical protein